MESGMATSGYSIPEAVKASGSAGAPDTRWLSETAAHKDRNWMSRGRRGPQHTYPRRGA